MPFDVNGKRVLLTGGSSGIGAALAEGFARQGATVGIAARRDDRLREVSERCGRHGARCLRWAVDLAEPGAAERLAANAVEGLGAVDVLVNSAGIPKRRHVTALDTKTVESVARLNYLTPVSLILALLPHLVGRPAAWIVNISSVAATLSSPGEAAYDGSKAALSAFSEAMAIDLWDTPVKVMVVYPGVIDTELYTVPDNDPAPDVVEPIPVDSVVDAVLQGIATDARQVYVPDWFESLAARKAADVGGFLAGVADFVRSRKEGVALDADVVAQASAESGGTLHL